MDRPYVLCHMTTSINGKITGKFLNESLFSVNEYYRLHRHFKANGFLCGRKTMESSFTNGWYPDLIKYQACIVSRDDYVESLHDFYAISIDFHGRLGWKDNCICDEDPGYNNAYIIEVVSENVDDAFLAYLRENKISYLFAGKDKLDIPLMLSKLKNMFNIDFVLLEGGGIINGSFLKEKCIDEISLVVAPFIEYSSKTKDLFYDEDALFDEFLLDDVRQENNNLLLRYKKR